MNVKTDILNPEIIVYAIFVIIISFFLYRKRKTFKKGVLIANTKYVKKTKLYKKIERRYKLYSPLIKISCVVLIIICSIMTARVFRQERKDITIEKNINNAEIMLCIEVGYEKFDTNLLRAYINLINKFPNEKFSVMIYGMWIDELIPFTSDHDYIINKLEYIIKEQNIINNSSSSSNEYKEAYDNLYKDMFKGTDPNYINRNDVYRSSYPQHHAFGWISECLLRFSANDNIKKILIFDAPSCNCQDLIEADYIKEFLTKMNVSLWITSSADTNIAQSITSITKDVYLNNELFSDSNGQVVYGKMVDDIVNRYGDLNITQQKEIFEYMEEKRTDIPELLYKYLLLLSILLLLFECRLGI